MSVFFVFFPPSLAAKSPLSALFGHVTSSLGAWLPFPDISVQNKPPSRWRSSEHAVLEKTHFWTGPFHTKLGLEIDLCVSFSCQIIATASKALKAELWSVSTLQWPDREPRSAH